MQLPLLHYKSHSNFLLIKGVSKLEKHISAGLSNHPQTQITSRRTRLECRHRERKEVTWSQMWKAADRPYITDRNVMSSIIQNKAYETLLEEGRPHAANGEGSLPHKTKDDAVSRARIPTIPQRETYVAEDEGCKAPASTSWCTSFLDPCHPHCHSQPCRKNLRVIVRKLRASGTQVDRWCLQILANSKAIITWGKWALEVWAVIPRMFLR